MVIELLRAFSLIFFAEMGDKSQILAMMFATKYRVRNVVIGITLGIFFNHLIAVLLGSYLTRIVAIENLSLFAGLLFVIFGITSLQVAEDIDEPKKAKIGTILTVSIAMFLGELGDKTQLATIILASDASYPVIILAGTVSAMIVTSLLGIYVGIKFGSRIPDFILKVISSLVFIMFGVIKIGNNLPSINNLSLYLYSFSVLFVLVYILLFTRFKRKYSLLEQSALQKTAQNLKTYYENIKVKLDSICLGLETCKTCSGSFCVIGYTKIIVSKIMRNERIDIEDIKLKLKKDFDKEKIVEALNVTIQELEVHWTESNYEMLHEIRNIFEMLLYSNVIEASTYKEYISKKNLYLK